MNKSATALSGLRPFALLLMLGVARVSNAECHLGRPAMVTDAAAIHRKLLAIDSHVDVLLPATPRRYFLSGNESRASVQRLLKGGIGAVALAVAVEGGPETAEGNALAMTEAQEKLRAIRSFIYENRAHVALALSAADIEKIHAAGEIAVVESFLNARSIGRDLSAIDRFYNDGVRLFGLTHAGNNSFADSSRPEKGQPSNGGLSELGRIAIRRMNDLGIIIDVSQMSKEAVLQAIQLSRAPVIASHSAIRSLVDRVRNLSDEEIDAIGMTGGVVHVTAFNSYLVKPGPETQEKVHELRARYGLPRHFPKNEFASDEALLDKAKQSAFDDDLAALYPKATVCDLVDHIEYVIRRIGVDHVGIGSDFNHGAGVRGFNDEADAPNITRELIARGYSRGEVAKVWGGNFLRVFRAVEGQALAGRNK